MGVDSLRWVRETDYRVDPSNESLPLLIDGEPVVVHQSWNLEATFAERPVAIIAIMSDGTVHRLDED